MDGFFSDNILKCVSLICNNLVANNISSECILRVKLVRSRLWFSCRLTPNKQLPAIWAKYWSYALYRASLSWNSIAHSQGKIILIIPSFCCGRSKNKPNSWGLESPVSCTCGCLCGLEKLDFYPCGFQGQQETQRAYSWWRHDMKIISVLLTLCEESIGERWIQRISNVELLRFLWC